MEFRWNEWNIGHIAEHGVSSAEVEWIVRRYRATDIGHDKYRVRGQTETGRYIQAIFLIDPDETVFVIHSRGLTEDEKRLFKRGLR